MITFDCCFRRYFVWAESIKRQQRPHKLKWVVTHVACTETIYFPFDRTAQFCLWLYGMESCLVILRCSPSLKKKKTSFVEPEIEFQKFKWKMKVFFIYIYCGNSCALQLNIPPICHIIWWRVRGTTFLLANFLSIEGNSTNDGEWEKLLHSTFRVAMTTRWKGRHAGSFPFFSCHTGK